MELSAKFKPVLLIFAMFLETKIISANKPAIYLPVWNIIIFISILIPYI